MSTTAPKPVADEPQIQPQGELAFIRAAKAHPEHYKLDPQTTAARLREAEHHWKLAMERLDKAAAAYFGRTEALRSAPAWDRVEARRDLHACFNRALRTVEFQAEVVAFYRERIARMLPGRDLNTPCPRCQAAAHVICHCR